MYQMTLYFDCMNWRISNTCSNAVTALKFYLFYNIISFDFIFNVFTYMDYWQQKFFFYKSAASNKE